MKKIVSSILSVVVGLISCITIGSPCQNNPNHLIVTSEWFGFTFILTKY